ncbi:MBL fold metallo-hydrolase [Candidatus Bathyarchaeota archaeon]|nr:MBL fold metallo-hydrolase [Candidatus Bathyarchaeota archaeon]
MELKWLGHASWMIKVAGKVVYIDPYEGDYDKGDIVLASHSHTDHCKQDKVKSAVGPKTKFIAPADCSKLGLSLTSLKPGEKIKIDGIEIEAVEAYNFKRFRSPGMPFHPKGFGVGYLIHAEGKTVYHTGDTDFIDEMKKIKDVDAMLVVSGGTYTMDNDEASEAVLSINPKTAFPMHIWDTDPKILKRKVEATSKIKVVLIKPGESYML